MQVWRRAQALAAKTPAHRDRYIDFLRAVAILAVIFGHWLGSAPYMGDEGLEISSMLGVAAWSHWLTWALQVMPIFFVVGGYANSASWAAAVRDGRTYRHWLQGRLTRLIGPVVPLLIGWVLITVTARLAGVDSELISDTSRLALVPTWFLAVYVGVILFVPAAAAAWRKFGLASFWLPVSAAVLVDTLAFGHGFAGLRWANYAFVWLAVHQLGFLWRAGRINELGVAAGWFMGGFAFLVFLVQMADYPVAMVSVPGAAFSNTRPPTVALAALAAMQFGLMALLRAPMTRWLERPVPWTITVLLNGFIMTMFLWHSTVMVMMIALAVKLGGIGLSWEPGSVGWWLARPAWILIMLTALLPMVGALGRFEQEAHRFAGSPWSTSALIAGTILTCLGLSLLAWAGIGQSDFPYVRVLPLSAALGGAALILAGPKRQPTRS